MGSTHHIKFSRPLLKWWHAHGRKDLPWQQDPSVYKTWISEIMLQQTQVITVIPYFKKFIKTFPSVTSLAEASEDQVMSHWSGLGFYSRARNLHKSAKIIVDQYKGIIPKRLEELIALPGIGRSTAGAILSLSSIAPSPILDGNVKRVLSRIFNIDPAKALNLFKTKRNSDLAEALMEFGALVCKPRDPICEECKIKNICSYYFYH